MQISDAILSAFLMAATFQTHSATIQEHPRPEILHCNVKWKRLCQSVYVLKTFDQSIPFSYGNLYIMASAVSQMAAYERKEKVYFVETFHI